MKTAIVVLTSLLGSAALVAQAPAAAPQKVGVINIQSAIGNSAQGKQQAAALQKRFAPRKAALQQEAAAVKALQQKLKAGGDTMSAAAKSELQTQLTDKERRLRQDIEDANTDWQSALNQTLGSLGQEMIPVIQEYAKAHGYSVILDYALGNPSPVLYYSPATDVTSAVVALFDKEHPAAPAAAPAAPAK